MRSWDVMLCRVCDVDHSARIDRNTSPYSSSATTALSVAATASTRIAAAGLRLFTRLVRHLKHHADRVRALFAGRVTVSGAVFVTRRSPSCGFVKLSSLIEALKDWRSGSFQADRPAQRVEVGP